MKCQYEGSGHISLTVSCNRRSLLHQKVGFVSRIAIVTDLLRDMRWLSLFFSVHVKKQHKHFQKMHFDRLFGHFPLSTTFSEQSFPHFFFNHHGDTFFAVVNQNKTSHRETTLLFRHIVFLQLYKSLFPF